MTNKKFIQANKKSIQHFVDMVHSLEEDLGMVPQWIYPNVHRGISLGRYLEVTYFSITRQHKAIKDYLNIIGNHMPNQYLGS